MPYYPKEYALRELTQLYSFTGLKNIQIHAHKEKEIAEQHNIHQENHNQTQIKAKNNKKKYKTKKYLKKKEKTGK